MALDQKRYGNYIDILREELVLALGCTEPIALAYASATARGILGEMPDRILAQCSGNIIKNVKGVVVPGSGGLRGIEAAVVLGAVAGDDSKELEVLADISPKALEEMNSLLQKNMCQVAILKTKAKLHMIVTAYKGEASAQVEIIHTHTGIVRMAKDGKDIFSVPFRASEENNVNAERAFMTVNDIIAFAKTVKIEDIADILEPQVRNNAAISDAGLKGNFGANVGATLRSAYGDDIKVRARAAAAAGSDARMSGCELPVVINSGSGNQGLTASLPVIEYAKELGCSKERLYRALALSNLVAIHQKNSIGRLSAYCGVVSAATGAGAGITYLHGGSDEEIAATITNTLANVAGIVCDGAKPSCAAKIASSVEAAILGHNMSMLNRTFGAGEGIVRQTVEETIEGVSRMARDGMQATDDEILRIMCSTTPYKDTKFLVIGTGHIGTYMRMCYESMTGGNLRGQVILAKATPTGLDDLQEQFDCEIVVADNSAALEKLKPDVIILCPPPSQIPAVVERDLLPYCQKQRQNGGTLPDIYTFGPSPGVDYYYDKLGADVNTVKVLPNMFHRTAELDSAYLEANFITFSDTHRWPQKNEDRLHAFLRPLVNTYEASEVDSVSWLGVRNAAHCLYDMCFLINDVLQERGMPGDHRNAASVMRAALRQHWDDMPKELTPCSLTDLEPIAAEFASLCCVQWVKGLTDFSIDDHLPERAGDIVRQNRVEAYLVTIGLYSRQELEAHTQKHATKGGVCEKSGLYFHEFCKEGMHQAFEQHLDRNHPEEFAQWWRQCGYEAAKVVARHGLTLANRR